MPRVFTPRNSKQDFPENGRLGGFGNDEWYTPAYVIEAARRAMGGIDLDPASCPEAQRTVKAGTYYTKEQDGLRQNWTGRVWLNPPYSAELAHRFSMKFALSYLEGKITCGILLVNNCTDNGWFQFLLERFPVLFTRGRIAYWGPGMAGITEDTQSTRQGQAIFNLGVDDRDFAHEFRSMGAYVQPVWPIGGTSRPELCTGQLAGKLRQTTSVLNGAKP